MTEKERINVMNEYVEDIMNQDDEEIEDEEVDKYIMDMQQQEVAKQKKKAEMNLDDYEDQLNDI